MKLILVADDNSDLCRTCMLALASREYSVIVASDGIRALELLRNHEIALLVTDLMVPGGGGNELITRAHREFPDLPVIAMTGDSAARQMLEGAARRGAIQTLEKPFETAAFVVAVEQALAGEPVAAAG